VRKTQSKKKSVGTPTVIPLDSSLTSIEWLPNMQIGENSSSSSIITTTTTSAPTTPVKQSLPVTTNIQQKLEAIEVELPTTTVNDNLHVKPPYSYVTPPKWKVRFESYKKNLLFYTKYIIIEFDSSQSIIK
jgi:hypothetical protein